MRGWISVTATFVLACAAVAHGGAIVELVPDQPGPYTGGESLGLDVWLHSEEEVPALLRGVRLDFTDTDPLLLLDSVFSFDFSSVPYDEGYQEMTDPTMPVPFAWMGWDIGSPLYYWELPAGGSLHIGSVGVELPWDIGVYRVDALNADEPDEALGAWIRTQRWLPDYPLGETWRAYTGEIGGDPYDFVIIPEPGTGCLFVVAALLVLTGRRHRPGRQRRQYTEVAENGRDRSEAYAVPLLLCFAIGLLGGAKGALGQPASVPSQIEDVSYDSGLVSAGGLEAEPIVVFSQVVSVQDARWVRLHFQQVQLSGSPEQGNEAFLRVTSQVDGAAQVLDSRAVSVWERTSAYFNGDSVLVELLAYPGTGSNRKRRHSTSSSFMHLSCRQDCLACQAARAPA